LVQGDPDELLTQEVGVSRVAEEPSSVEAWLEVLASPTSGNLGRLLVSVLGLVEVPLRAVGKELEDNEGHEDAGDDYVGGVHALTRNARGKHEDVGGSGDHEEQNTLGDADKQNVEDEEERAIDPAAYCFPSVILGADAVSTSAPVVERQAHGPHDTKGQYVIESLSREAIHTSPDVVVDVVDGR